MPSFTVDSLRKLMSYPSHIRNISIIAHVDHGKTTLTDSLIAACGIIPMEKAGDVCMTDTMDLEKQKGITIRSTGISLYFEVSETIQNNNNNNNNNENNDDKDKDKDLGYIINLVDSPGHVDFSSEVSAALRVTDGALVIVDCIEGVCVQTETVLRQALTERIRPVLCLNKLDRAFLELKYESERMYQEFCRIIEDVNNNISTYGDETMGDDVQVGPEKGTVAFCAGKQAWAFTLNSFARLLAPKFKTTEQELVQKLWGDNFWDPDQKKWITTSTSPSGKKLERGFCQYVLEPIRKVFELAGSSKLEALEALLQRVNVKLSKEDKEKKEKDLIKASMQKWLPAHTALLEMITKHLPSPATAQRYRAEHLYEGPMDDECALAIRNCDPAGPLMIFISKLVQEKNRFWAFGRVFSGTARAGAKVRVLDANYNPSSKEGVSRRSLQRLLIMMGKFTESIEDIPCGNTIGIVGVDDVILKTATITSSETAYPMKQMKYSVSPVVRCAVQPESAGDLLKLMEGLKRLVKVDPLVQCRSEDTGEHIISAAGELHMEVCLHILRELTGIAIKTSEPIVTFKETITAPSSVSCLSKSANKHNRLWMKAEPLGEELTLAIENGVVTPLQDPKVRGKLLSSNYGWQPDDTKKIWCFGPEGTGPNVVVDVTKGNQQLIEIKDSVVASFNWVSESGVLCEENLRGCRFNILNAELHADAIHRGGGQIIPCARRALLAAELTAEPKLQEPVFLVEIQCPQGPAISAIHNVLNKKRGYIIEELPRVGTNLSTIKAHLPVMESFGFTGDLRAATSGQAFPTLIFDHWAIMNGSPFDKEGKIGQLIQTIRKRKGLPLDIPALEHYLDRL